MVLLLIVAACRQECRGPACEDAWPAGTVLVTDRDGLASASGIDTLQRRLIGSAPQGARWQITAHDDGLVVGLPERGAVVRTTLPEGPTALGDPTLERIGEAFGAAVAVVDSDGDGIPELWVGAPDHDDGRGAVYRYPLDATDPDGWTHRFVGGSSADGLGTVVVACGDLDGDGDDDLVTTAPRFIQPPDGPDLAPPSLAGTVFALLDPTSSTAPWDAGPVWWGDAPGVAAGWSIACQDDVTGDGLPDVLIGVPFAGDDDSGRVHVRPGGDGVQTSGPLTATDPWTILPPDAGSQRFGTSLATWPGGVAVGAPQSRGGAGRVHVYTGLDASPGVAQPTSVLDNPRSIPDHLGRGLASGVLDDDGVYSLIIGAPDRRTLDATSDARTAYDTGALWIWRPGDPPLGEPDLVGTTPFARVGRDPVLHDGDGDGIDEVLLPLRTADPEDVSP